MRHRLFRLVVQLKCLMTLESGQDLVEYALIVAMMAVGATAAINSVANSVTGMYVTISTALSHAM